MKPLTKEEREIAERMFTPGQYATEPGIVARLLEAEQFWREAVKNQNPIIRVVNIDDCAEEDDECFYCENRADGSVMEHADHKPDCAWLLAQE